MAMVLRLEYRPEVSQTEARGHIEREPADYRELVFRLALAISGERDGAEDIAQDVMLKLLAHRKELARVDNPVAWVRQVTARCAINHLKRRKNAEPLPRCLESKDEGTDNLAVYEILKRMQPEQRTILGMAIGQGLSYAEIGEALGIPEGTVASRLNAAKKEFQRMWEQ
jgi:RNA polymerase sigma-70 factor (ECF subfamily)